MGTKHLFKNVRTLTTALTLRVAFAAMMLTGCKKDEPWGSLLYDRLDGGALYNVVSYVYV